MNEAPLTCQQSGLRQVATALCILGLFYRKSDKSLLQKTRNCLDTPIFDEREGTGIQQPLTTFSKFMNRLTYSYFVTRTFNYSRQIGGKSVCSLKDLVYQFTACQLCSNKSVDIYHVQQ